MTNTAYGKIQMLFEKAKEFGWSIDHDCDNIYRFSKYSPASQDFGIEVDTEADPALFINNLLAIYEDFDVSEEAYIWLGPDGHGANGAPHDMKDVYEDMKACEGMISELYDKLSNYCDELYEEED